jgi:hypothetical protein
MIKLGSPMIDGCKSGIKINSDKEFRRIKDRLIDRGGLPLKEESGSILVLDHLGKSKATVKCQEYGGGFFLNLDGNPISYLTGQNVLGEVSAELILLFWTEILSELSLLDLKSFKDAIGSANIFLHFLAIAGYSRKLGPNKVIRQTLNVTDFVYSAVGEDGETVKDWVGVAVHREGKYSIRFDRKKGKNRYWSLGLYDKIIELDETGKESLIVSSIAQRLRFDLSLYSSWLHANKLKTLKDLDLRIRSSDSWAADLFDAMLNRLYLRDLLKFDLSDLVLGDYEEDFNDYLGGGKPSADAIDWFLRQNVNIKIPFKILSLASMARFVSNTSTEQRRNYVVDNYELPNLLKVKLPTSKQIRLDSTFSGR